MQFRVSVISNRLFVAFPFTYIPIPIYLPTTQLAPAYTYTTELKRYGKKRGRAKKRQQTAQITMGTSRHALTTPERTLPPSMAAYAWTSLNT
jgi:hypothetical protein